MDLSDLRAGGQLTDDHLGRHGAIYVIDNLGNILGAQMAGEQIVVNPSDGVFRYRRINELAAPWASHVEKFDGTEQDFSAEGFFIVVRPLRGRGLGNFSVLVAAERDEFVDTRLVPFIEASKVVAVLPYPVLFLLMAFLQFLDENKRRKNLRRVHVLHEGMATLVHEAMPDSEGLPYGTSDGMSALRKRTLAKTITAERNAEASMSHFLEKSSTATDTQLAILGQIKYQNLNPQA